ncbi:hypothetical protein [Chryseobacterium vrystaatense]|uniref:Uncharacterized protein n=1 Tax=Chryseobacterium vrystaatense TaxID=307480 RepID=A0ABR4UPD6_9FLAO|nr:hypothetical protein [Chryseobacterium vrystaatense]KFF26871.1 hypothetical protein IW16_06220 [Chryseobacterium vrystaatense]
MNTHEKTIKIITELGMQAKKIAEILSVSLSASYKKMKMENDNKFTDSDFEAIKKHILKVSKTLR